MTPPDLERQLAFLREIDRLKSIVRLTPLIDRSRRENSAEHSWHLAMYALVLAEHAAGSIDILRVVRVLADNGFDGVVIPDHSPLVSCDTPWLTGMAYALGYIRAAMQAVERGCTIPDARGM